MVFRVVTWIITVIIGAVPALCPRCAKTPPVYEAFHATLAREFPTTRFFVYVNDIAVVAPDNATLHKVLRRTRELSMLLGFRVNHSKSEIYRWAPRHKSASVTMGRKQDKNPIACV